MDYKAKNRPYEFMLVFMLRILSPISSILQDLSSIRMYYSLKGKAPTDQVRIKHCKESRHPSDGKYRRRLTTTSKNSVSYRFSFIKTPK